MERKVDPHTVTEFDEVVIEVTHKYEIEPKTHPLAALLELVDKPRRGSRMVGAFKVVKGWRVRAEPLRCSAVFRGRLIPVSQLDDLLVRLNSSGIDSLRIKFRPDIPDVPARLFESLFVPGLRMLHYDQGLTHADEQALAAFLGSQAGRSLEHLRINRHRLSAEGMTVLMDALAMANVRYIDYRFEPRTPILEIDLDPLSHPGSRRHSNGLIALRKAAPAMA